MGTKYAELGAEFIPLENVGGKTLAKKLLNKNKELSF
jgi:hypothetical protein